VFLGPRVQPGFTSMQHVTHYTVLRTLCEALQLPPVGAAAFELPLSEGWLPAVSDANPPHGATPWLGAPSPNPSRGITTVLLRLPHEELVQAALFDLAGRRVRTLTSALRSGDVTLAWDGRGDDGNRVCHGLYVLRVRAGSVELRRKLIRADAAKR
jgi:hypothetical protein